MRNEINTVCTWIRKDNLVGAYLGGQMTSYARARSCKPW
jgi:hypothetical protein